MATAHETKVKIIDRLDRDLAVAGSSAGGTEERAAEGEHAVAVAGGALGEEHDDVPPPDPRGDRLGLRHGLRPFCAVDEDGPLQAG